MGSLLELAVAAALVMTITASVFTVLNPAQGSFQRELEAADAQQRLRVAAGVLGQDLLMAGSGAYSGPVAEPLGRHFAPVLPLRHGLVDGDPPGTFRPDAVTVVFVPALAAQALMLSAMPAQAGGVTLADCPPADPACGFAAGMDVLLYDDLGSYDWFTIADVAGATLQLQHDGLDRPVWYAAGSPIVQAIVRTYYLDRQTWQLMRYDGGGAPALPVVDHVVGLAIEYFGDPQPPQLVRPPSDPNGGETTYGPLPRAGQGNCIFQLADDEYASRLATLGPGPSLVRLDASILSDGPWCPDEADANRWDADLLRIRRLVVSIRVEAAQAWLRGPAAALVNGLQAFANPGSATNAARWVADQEFTILVSPRNLNGGR